MPDAELRTIQVLLHLILVIVPQGGHFYYWWGKGGLGCLFKSYPSGMCQSQDSNLEWSESQTNALTALLYCLHHGHSIRKWPPPSVWKWKQFNVFYIAFLNILSQLYVLQHTDTSNPFYYHISLSFGESSTFSSLQLPSLQSPNFLFRNSAK